MNMAYRRDFGNMEEKELNSKFPGGTPDVKRHFREFEKIPLKYFNKCLFVI